MDGKDKIIEKILSDAEDYKTATIRRADEDYANLVGEAEVRARQIIDDETEVLQKEQADALKRKKVVADLDGKKVYLSKKTEAVDTVFSSSLEKLNNLDKSTYKSVIERLIQDNAVQNSTVVLSKNAPITADDVLNFDVSKRLNLKVSANGEFSGGVIIETETSDVNLSFQAIVDGLKERYETMVAEKLFD